MAIIDLDSHLRDGWLLDEIYQLPEPFAKYTPKRIGEGKYFYSKFEHDLSPMEDPVANANFEKPVTHQVFYNSEAEPVRHRLPSAWCGMSSPTAKKARRWIGSGSGRC
jgi:hypothetical protein